MTTRRQRDEALRNKVWRVLDTDGEIYEVHPGHMEANADDHGQGARQLQWVSGVITGHRTANYTTISALHKEIRRGDYPRAYLWAKTVIRFRKEKGLREYMRSILWEETRNIELYREWRENPGMPWEEMLQQFCGATKKWEYDTSPDTALIQIRAMLDAHQLPSIEDGELLHPPAIDKFEYYNWVLMVHRCFARALREGGGKLRDTRAPRLRAFRILSGTLRKALEREGLKAWTEPFDKRTDFDDVMQTSEKLCGLLEGSNVCEVRRVNTELFEADIAMPEPRVFDGHTSKGAGMLRKWVRKYAPLEVDGYRQPMLPGMDMRWSGQQLGVWWRSMAVKVFGRGYSHVDWEDVDFGRKLWKDAVMADNNWFQYLND